MIVTVILAVSVVLLGIAAVLTLIRMSKGPRTLDRVIAADVTIAIVIAALATEAMIHRHTTTLPVILVLALIGFAGSLSIARFVSDRDKAVKWDVQIEADPREEDGR
ncbi:monovalent cation/H+ antiporter complex subunit F [Microlunatus speluncae]|uniref:monovalent cation/H+ antiporter complex subunit F n=1 Tax=Microlunatus speluncae TaxID=2594267 RepID=UPI00126638AC|nr:monovalent cation/H+ antiporter complex subunit F [Microlunatus speluncae]